MQRKKPFDSTPIHPITELISDGFQQRFSTREVCIFFGILSYDNNIFRQHTQPGFLFSVTFR